MGLEVHKCCQGTTAVLGSADNSNSEMKRDRRRSRFLINAELISHVPVSTGTGYESEFRPPGKTIQLGLIYSRHRLAPVDHLREACVVMQADAVKADIWAAILTLVLVLASGPDSFPPLLSVPDKYPIFSPPRRTQPSRLYPLQYLVWGLHKLKSGDCSHARRSSSDVPSVE